jgi:WD40 repeat protein
MFDPYHKWLGISPDQQPPTLYQLLGISPREQDLEVIEEAAIRQTAHVRTYQNGPHAQECARILSEIARARATLLDPAKRQAYDLRLAHSAAPREVGQAAPSAAIPVAQAAEEFQFLDSPAAVASAGGELPDGHAGSVVPTLARKRSGGSAGARKLAFIGAIVLGGAIPVGIVAAILMLRSPPAPTQPARGNGGEVAQANPTPKATTRTTPATQPATRPAVKPEPKPDPDFVIRPRPEDPPDNGGNRPNTGRPDTKRKPVKNIPTPPPDPPPVTVKKTPVPDADKQAAADKLIRDLFKKDFLAARKPADKQTLAAKLMQQAEETKDDPAARFMLLREARDLAAQAGDVAVALSAAEETIRTYEVEPVPLKLATLTAVSRGVATAPANKELVDAILLVLDDVLAADDFDTATKLLALAEPAARSAMSAALASKVQGRVKDLTELKKESEAVQAAAESLRQKPDDPLANVVTGKYLCFRKGKWDEGLPKLARGDDAVAELARKDLAGPKEAAAQAELGDGWWGLAEALHGGAEIVVKGRADFWYQKALPNLTGLTQTRVEKRIKEYAAKAPGQKGPAVAGELVRFTGHKDRVTCVAITADGTRAVSGSADGAVIMWDTETGKEVQRFNSHRGEVGGVAISSDGTRVTSGGRDGIAMYYFLDQGRKTHSFSGFKSIECMSISPDGRSPLIGTAAGVVQVWSPEPGGLSGRWSRARGVAIHSVAFSPDGRLVLFSASDGVVRLWDPLTNQESRLTARLPDVRSVAFSPDSRQLITGGADRVIRLWDVRNGKEVRAFKGHTGRVNSAAFTSDGNSLLSASDDKTVRLWEVKTGRELHRYPWHTDKVTSVAVSGDGRLAISGGDDRTVRVWNLPK